MSKIHTLDFSDLAKFYGLDMSDIASIYGLDVCSEIGVSENFEGTGFQLTGWSIQDDSGTGVDEDFDATSVTGAPAGWGSQCLLIERGIWEQEWITRVFPDPAVEYHKFEFIIETGPAFGQSTKIFKLTDITDFEIHSLLISNDLSTSLINIISEGASQFVGDTLSLDTLHTLEIRLDRPAREWEWKLDGVLQRNNVDDSPPITSPGTLIVTPQTNDDLFIGGFLESTSIKMYFDNWEWSSCGWVN